ncbi:helix-turn-helix domain containing protein [Mucilaginibacter sp. KACC 22773]|jgi:AcrR family transcriptional regulator|uniref:TetR/AcrR family transcriptional regulator n=1 Tax=Mucilaginibacter sp. KACC 22773 TaxID=3025671 RepID=UPI002366E2D9|nr:TetR/AcrR family transcriptional regulator [Mucilaginibacter sp. KACC 22773]WDF81310.1 helix-turn-helix domain containing protein [Mucilaginibacter sp. KACC 22773]
MKADQNDSIREEIIAAADTVFQRYGFVRVSMQDISNECKKGRSTLYHYFKNKTELLAALCHKMFSQCLEESKATISKRRSFSANLESFNEVKIKRLRELVLKYKLVIEDMRQEPSLLIMQSRIMSEEEILAVKLMIKWAMENKEIAELNEEDSQFLAETLQTVFKSFDQEIILFGRFPQFESKITWLAQIIHKGLM